jgi:uncharacterized protein
MENLKDLISAEIIKAMKAQAKTRLNVLRYLKKLFIENDTSGNPKPEIDIIIAYAKKVKDSLALYPADSAQAQEIKAEIVVLDEFLPKQLSQAEVIDLINQIKASQSNPNMGSIMKDLNPHIKGRFDGKLASDLVKAAVN